MNSEEFFSENQDKTLEKALTVADDGPEPRDGKILRGVECVPLSTKRVLSLII